MSVGASEANKLIQQWTDILDRIRKLIADHATFLPTYDSEKAQQEFKTLQESFEDAKSKVLPRKRFTFNRAKKTQGLAKASEILTTDNKDEGKEAMMDTTDVNHASQSSSNQSTDELLAKFEKDLLTVENQHDCHIILRDGVVQNNHGDTIGKTSDSGDIRLVNMSNCVIVL